jgi:hypothetical protein
MGLQRARSSLLYQTIRAFLIRFTTRLINKKNGHLATLPEV